MTHVEPVAAANRALGRRFFEEQDRLRGGPAEALCAPTYEATLGGSSPVNRIGHAAFASAFYSAFLDIRHRIDDVFATDDRVAVRFVLEGTHTGSFFGVPPSNRRIAVPANVLMHVANGQVTKLFGVFDEAGLLRQIGAIPA